MTAARKPTQRRIGSYLLGRRIGAGGMAAVFAARQTGPLDLGRLVALKVMSTALVGDPASEQMFLREAGISARIEHKNVVRVYEVGEADGTLFIAMELVHGRSLRELSSERPPLDVALRIVDDVAAAAHAAHELCDAEGASLGLVHQDISPQNIMVTYDGLTKLLDFGVARVGALDRSRTDTVRGKPSYLAPEQIAGRRVDRRTDVFALGIVLHELLSGERLFARPSALETYKAITEDPIPRLPAAVPEPIAAICARALERDPEARFAHMAALRKALANARDDAGLELCDEARLGEWVASVCPPLLEVGELEREIVRAGAPPAFDVSDRPTIPPEEPLSHAPESDRRSSMPFQVPTSRTPLVVLASLVALVIGGLAAYLWLPSDSTTGASASPATTATTATSAVTSQSAPPASGGMAAPASAASLVPAPTSSAPRHGPRAPARPPPSSSSRATSLPASSSTHPPAPSASTAPSAPAAVAMGSIGVFSVPAGQMSVNGQSHGTTPRRVPVEPGTYIVTVVTKERGSASRTVTVGPGQSQTVRFTF